MLVSFLYIKLHNANEDMWLKEFHRKWKDETELIHTKCRCVQAKIVVYKIFRGYTLKIIRFMERCFRGGGLGALSPDNPMSRRGSGHAIYSALNQKYAWNLPPLAPCEVFVLTSHLTLKWQKIIHRHID